MDSMHEHRMLGGILILVLTLAAATAPDKGGDKADTPEEQYKAILKEFNDAAHANWNATSDEERKQIAARIENLPRAVAGLRPSHAVDRRSPGERPLPQARAEETCGLEFG